MGKYLDLINESAEETAKTNNNLVAEEASLSLQAAIVDSKKQLATCETAYAQAMRLIPFNANALYCACNSIELTKRKIEKLKALHSELF